MEFIGKITSFGEVTTITTRSGEQIQKREIIVNHGSESLLLEVIGPAANVDYSFYSGHLCVFYTVSTVRSSVSESNPEGKRNFMTLQLKSIDVLW